MRTDEKLEELKERLQHNCGDIHEAARYCGVSAHFVYSWMKDDPVANEALNEAKRIGYGAIESELIRRAVKGVEEDIYYKGEVVGYKTVYSDGLLSKLAEAKLPEFNKQESSGANFYGPTQINVMPRADTYEEWLAMRDATLNRDQEALPPPAVEAEFSEVTDDRPLRELAGLL